MKLKSAMVVLPVLLILGACAQQEETAAITMEVPTGKYDKVPDS